MKIVQSKTFRSGNSVAVRLPRELGFGVGVDIEMVQDGGEVVIRRRAHSSGKDLADALNALPKPRRSLVRQPIEFPERPKL
jgi:antitoxin VapB